MAAEKGLSNQGSAPFTRGLWLLSFGDLGVCLAVQGDAGGVVGDAAEPAVGVEGFVELLGCGDAGGGGLDGLVPEAGFVVLELGGEGFHDGGRRGLGGGLFELIGEEAELVADGGGFLGEAGHGPGSLEAFAVVGAVEHAVEVIEDVDAGEDPTGVDVGMVGLVLANLDGEIPGGIDGGAEAVEGGLGEAGGVGPGAEGAGRLGHEDGGEFSAAALQGGDGGVGIVEQVAGKDGGEGLFFFGDESLNEAAEGSGEGQDDGEAEYIESGVEHGRDGLGGAGGGACEPAVGGGEVAGEEQEGGDGGDDVVEEVGEAGAARGGASADGGEQSGGGGADVGPDDDGSGLDEIDEAGVQAGEGGGHGDAGALGDHGDDGPDEDEGELSADRVATPPGEIELVPVAAETVLKVGDAEEDEAESGEGFSKASQTFAGLEQIGEGSDEKKGQGGGGELEFESDEGHQPSGCGGANIGTEDEAQRLLEGHEPGGDEPDHGDRGGTGTLDDGGDGGAGDRTRKGTARGGGQPVAEAIPRELSEAGGHGGHAVEKEAEAAESLKERSHKRGG